MKWLEDVDQFKWTVLVVCLVSLGYGILWSAVLSIAIWMVRDEIIRPYFYKAKEDPNSNSMVQARLDSMQRELNGLKLGSAMRTLS
jgi:hypothetical protein